MRNHEVGGRNITLDVHAIDVNGEEIDIEVQCNSEGSHIRRARFHSSMVDSRMLGEGQKFKELKDSYVIFIYKHDKFRKGLPLYHIDRYVRETNEFKETEEGREQMCEAVEKYGDERAITAKIVSVQNLMKNTKFTLEQALDALEIQGDERKLITKQLQK